LVPHIYQYARAIKTCISKFEFELKEADFGSTTAIVQGGDGANQLQIQQKKWQIARVCDF
jgi:hypothetical protein